MHLFQWRKYSVYPAILLAVLSITGCSDIVRTEPQFAGLEPQKESASMQPAEEMQVVQEKTAPTGPEIDQQTPYYSGIHYVVTEIPRRNDYTDGFPKRDEYRRELAPVRQPDPSALRWIDTCTGRRTAEGVTIAVFADGVDRAERKPHNSVCELGNRNKKVFYFTELHDQQNHTVSHVWEYKGQVMAEVPFEVGGKRWRVWSSKNFMPKWTGVWVLKVIRDDGVILHEDLFRYFDE